MYRMSESVRLHRYREEMRQKRKMFTICDIDHSPVANTWGFSCFRHNGWRPVARPLSYCAAIGWNVLNVTMMNANDLIPWIYLALQVKPIDGHMIPAMYARVLCPATPNYCQRSNSQLLIMLAWTVIPLDLWALFICSKDMFNMFLEYLHLWWISLNK